MYCIKFEGETVDNVPDFCAEETAGFRDTPPH